MKRTVLLLILAVITMTGTACSAEREPPLPTVEPVITTEAPRERKTAARIVTAGGICSAIKLGPQTLLTASHCFRTATRLIFVDGVPAAIERIHQDKNDHALVLLSHITMKNFAKFGAPPSEGDNIHYWGSPYVFNMLLRRGYVSGFDEVNTLYDANGYHGDSGAGVFNEQRQLVAVISYIHGKESFAMMGSYPLNFTAQQLKDVGLKPEPRLMTGVVAVVDLNYSD
jgi:hypothetical protein